jgi:hypothetical protein
MNLRLWGVLRHFPPQDHARYGGIRPETTIVIVLLEG